MATERVKHYQPDRATRICPSILIIIPSLIWMCERGGYGISPSSYRAEVFSRLSLSSRGGWGLSHTRYDQLASVTLAIEASKYSVDLSGISGLAIEGLISGSDCRLPRHPYFTSYPSPAILVEQHNTRVSLACKPEDNAATFLVLRAGSWPKFQRTRWRWKRK